jgi:selenide,water dikinase
MEAGAPVVGGHSVESRDLMYGLAVVGEVHPDHLFRNDTIEAGDQLILTKALGTGALTTAVRADKLALTDIEEAIAGMTQLNRDAVVPLRAAGVKAVTDITGFGLLGHAAEMAKASGVQLVIEQRLLPELPRAREMLQRKQRTRGDKTNLAYARQLGPVQGDPESLIRDAQTSGGLLAAVKPEKLEALLDALRAAGYGRVVRMGEARQGSGILAI